jgi:hypothetical protein
MLQLILTQPLQRRSAWSQEAQTTLTNVIGEANDGHYLGLPVEVEMLDASACVFHLLLIFR